MSSTINVTVQSVASATTQFVILSNGEQVYSGHDVGVHVVLFNSVTGQVILTESFDTNNAAEDAKLIALLKSAPIGCIVAIATCGSVQLSREAQVVCTTVGSYLVHSFSPGKTWSLIGVKGYPSAMAQEL